ncbi:DNA-binding response regulator, araC family [Vibrio ishigakensis]|uniref:Autoinducer 2-binding periplasmic protein LuxP n=1 Tax=Vibrio ishigakensis TaxID=1481914 RepID=A0A0B8NUB2_9VIBR|nr:DNA-binding response regulator, araC family [Vibrio ishigakensis]
MACSNECRYKKAAEAAGYKVIFKDAQNDSLKQKSQVVEFMNSNIDLLIISPNEAAPLTKPVREVYKKGIPVIVLDRKVVGSDYTTYISADNKKIGLAAGKWIADNFPKGTKTVELRGQMTATPAQDRHNGFREGAKDAGLDIVFDVEMKWLESIARQEMSSALGRFDDIDLVYAHNDPGAHGAYMAAKAAGREKDIKFVGIDALAQEGQIYVKKGILAASFEYPTGGEEAIKRAGEIFSGKEVPKEIILPSRVFTPDNVDEGGEWL